LPRSSIRDPPSFLHSERTGDHHRVAVVLASLPRVVAGSVRFGEATRVVAGSVRFLAISLHDQVQSPPLQSVIPRWL
jgi:hypothetical protein